jgi:hypothetical protein
LLAASFALISSASLRIVRKLQARELAAADSLAAVAEEEGPTVLEPDRKHDEREQR